MAILLEIFDEERARLVQRIEEQPTPENVARRVRSFLETLPREYEKRKEPTLNQKRRLGFMTDLLKEVPSLLTVHKAELHWPYSPTVRSGGRGGFLLKRAAQAILLLLLLGGLLSIGAFFAVLLLLLLLAVTLPRQVIGQPQKLPAYLLSQVSEVDKDGSERSDETNVRAIARVNATALVGKLREIIRTADIVLEDEGHEPPPPPDNPLHEAHDLLEFFQDLSEAQQFQDAEFALKKLRSLKRLLGNHDIRLEDFRVGQNERHFNFLPGGGSNYTMQRPALLSTDDRLLLRGAVLEPSDTK